jgi:hypothetical protein
MVLTSAGAVFVLVPTTAAFDVVSHWCLDVTVLGSRFVLGGHPFVDVLLAVPILAIAGGVVRTLVAMREGLRVIDDAVASAAVGFGPSGTVLVGDPAVYVMAAGLRRSRVLVSVGALRHLTEAELAAAIERERGHAHRHHAAVLALADLLSAIAQVLPGTAIARNEVLAHVERDADAWALRRGGDAQLMARALCKASAVDEGLLIRRLDELLDDDAYALRRQPERRPRAWATAMALAVALVFVPLGVTAHAGMNRAGAVVERPHCL